MKVRTNFLVNKLIGVGRMVHRELSYNERHKTHNCWYSGMLALIYSIVDVLILYTY